MRIKIGKLAQSAFWNHKTDKPTWKQSSLAIFLYADDAFAHLRRIAERRLAYVLIIADTLPTDPTRAGAAGSVGSRVQ